MRTNEAMAELYTILSELLGPSKAREHVATIVSLIISDLQDQKLPVSAEEIEIRLVDHARTYRSMWEHQKKKSIA